MVAQAVNQVFLIRLMAQNSPFQMLNQKDLVEKNSIITALVHLTMKEVNSETVMIWALNMTFLILKTQQPFMQSILSQLKTFLFILNIWFSQKEQKTFRELVLTRQCKKLISKGVFQHSYQCFWQSYFQHHNKIILSFIAHCLQV